MLLWHGWGSLAQSQMSLFFCRIPVPAKISCHVPETNLVEAVTRDMASSDWLKLAHLCFFHAQSVSKNTSICDCPGARPQNDKSNSHLMQPWLKTIVIVIHHNWNAVFYWTRTYHVTRLKRYNSLGRTKLTNFLGKQQIEPWTCTWTCVLKKRQICERVHRDF